MRIPPRDLVWPADPPMPLGARGVAERSPVRPRHSTRAGRLPEEFLEESARRGHRCLGLDPKAPQPCPEHDALLEVVPEESVASRQARAARRWSSRRFIEDPPRTIV